MTVDDRRVIPTAKAPADFRQRAQGQNFRQIHGDLARAHERLGAAGPAQVVDAHVEVPCGFFHDLAGRDLNRFVARDEVFEHFFRDGDVDLFMGEAKDLEKSGHDLKSRLYISKKAHLIMPTHRVLDAAIEASKGKNKVGTTGKGIGPTYTDKVSRTGLRVGDILDNFEEKYAAHKAAHLKTIASLGYTDFDITEVEKTWMEGIEYLKQFKLIDSEVEINKVLRSGKDILCEGAQGTMLDVDFGSYPFVTSSNTICAGACTGLGVGPNRIGNVYGIMKAYCTRVGAGPFPTELFDETGDKIRDLGHEYGAVTGRERRCGWCDLVQLKYSVMVNGVTELIMMKSDVLDGFDTIKACVAYKLKDGSVTTDFPYEIDDVEPVYKEFKGWKTDMTKFTSEDQFPQEFKDYIAFVEEFLETKIGIISIGPDRAQTIVRK